MRYYVREPGCGLEVECESAEAARSLAQDLRKDIGGPVRAGTVLPARERRARDAALEAGAALVRAWATYTTVGGSYEAEVAFGVAMRAYMAMGGDR